MVWEAHAGRQPLRGDKGSGLENPFQRLANGSKQVSRLTAVQNRMGHSMVVQRLVNPPNNPPINGVRGGTLNGDGVPTESHLTTPHGGNNLIGTVPGNSIIKGWPYVQSVNASGAWVRFHLVNQQLGGLGNQNNLVPTSQATNHQSAWKAFETKCKHHDNKNRAIHVSVDVTYPGANIGAFAGTRAANEHFYPTNITAAAHYWDSKNSVWKLADTANITPFPLLPPANGTQTDLRNQSGNWLATNLVASKIGNKEANAMVTAFQTNGAIDQYMANSIEPTQESQLLDAVESYIVVDLEKSISDTATIHILNGVYHV